MAEFNQEEFFNQLIDALKKFGAADKGLDNIIKSMKKGEDAFDSIRKHLSDYHKTAKITDRSSKDILQTIKSVDKQLKLLEDEIAEHERAIENSTDAEVRHMNAAEIAHKKKLIHDEKAKLAELARSKRMDEALREAGTGVTKVAIDATKAAKQMFTIAQDGAHGTQMASQFLISTVDMVGKAGISVGSTIKDMGMFGMMTRAASARFRTLSSAAYVLGGAFEGVSKGVSELAKFGIEVLQKEVNKLIQSYADSTTAGALFSNGMSGLKDAANSGGLSLNQFSNVIKNNVNDLTSMGMTVGRAATKIGQVNREFDRISIGGVKLRNQLLNLGYSYEEQAGLITSYAANIAAAGGPQRLLSMTNEELAKNTAQYAKDLRILSAITGEDAKKKMEEARKASLEADVFAQIMQTSGEKGLETFQKLYATMPEFMKKAVLEQISGGVVTDVSSVIAMQAAPQFKNAVIKMQEMALNPSLNSSEALVSGGKLIEESLVNLREATHTLRPVTLAARFTSDATTKGVQEMLTSANIELTKRAKGTTATAVSDAENLSKTNDKLQQSMNLAADAGQKLQIAIERLVTPALGNYATVTGKIVQSFEELINIVGKALNIDALKNIKAEKTYEYKHEDTISDKIFKSFDTTKGYFKENPESIAGMVLGGMGLKGLAGITAGTIKGSGIAAGLMTGGATAATIGGGSAAALPPLIGVPAASGVPVVMSTPAAGALGTAGILSSAMAGPALMAAPAMAASVSQANIRENPNDPKYKNTPYAMMYRGEVNNYSEAIGKNRRTALEAYRERTIKSSIAEIEKSPVSKENEEILAILKSQLAAMQLANRIAEENVKYSKQNAINTQ